jgi:hypothetical protein
MAKLTNRHNLLVVKPDIAKQWHPTKNGKLTPRDVTPGSGKRVWWRCKKGHEWQARTSTRKYGHGCPYCMGLFASKENNLQIINPKLSREWHPTRNGKLTPQDITPNSAKKVWWKCSKGHVWKATVNNRNHGTGCQKCRYISSQEN